MGCSALNIARSLAAFSFSFSGVSFEASASFFFAVLVSVTVGLTEATPGLVSSARTPGASVKKQLRQPIAKANRAVERFGLFTQQVFTSREEKWKVKIRI